MREFEGQLDTYIKDIRPRYEDMLGQAVEIPSISMDPTYAPDIVAWPNLRRNTCGMPARRRRSSRRRAIRSYRAAG